MVAIAKCEHGQPHACHTIRIGADVHDGHARRWFSCTSEHEEWLGQNFADQDSGLAVFRKGEKGGTAAGQLPGSTQTLC